MAAKLNKNANRMKLNKEGREWRRVLTRKCITTGEWQARQMMIFSLTASFKTGQRIVKVPEGHTGGPILLLQSFRISVWIQVNQVMKRVTLILFSEEYSALQVTFHVLNIILKYFKIYVYQLVPQIQLLLHLQ